MTERRRQYEIGPNAKQNVGARQSERREYESFPLTLNAPLDQRDPSAQEPMAKAMTA